MFEKIRITVIITCLGICAGLGAHYLLDKETGILVKRPLSISIPESGIQTDAFGIQLLQASMDIAPGASCLVSPFLVSEALMELRELAETPIQQQIDKLGISGAETEHTAYPNMNVTVAADAELPFSEENRNEGIMRLPFRSNFPIAMSLFNGALGSIEDETSGVVVGSNFLSSNTNFVVGLYADFNPKLQTPFLSCDSTVSDFENANGSLPKVRMMRLRANVRHAKDTNGDWEAVALLLSPHSPTAGEPTAFVAILPTQPAANMAAALTAEQLGTIRKALAEATPTDCCVALPQMRWSPPTRNLTPILRNIGLDRLFDINDKNWAFVERKLGLDAVTEKIGITMTPSRARDEQRPKVDNAATTISFNRPFIWFIGDLTTASPAYYIGLVQNL